MKTNTSIKSNAEIMKETNILIILDEIEIYLDEIACEYSESDLAWKKAVDSLDLVNNIREIIREGEFSRNI